MNKVLIINPPSIDRTVNRDMAGGLGYSAGEGVVLAPLDLLNIAATLKKRGWNVFFIDSVVEKKYDIGSIFRFVKVKKIEVVIGNLSLPTLDEDLEFYRVFKKKFKKIKIFAKTGINYKEILNNAIIKTKIDAIIFTECDLNIEKYIFGQEKSGSVVIKNNKVVIYPMSKTVDDLDRLPISARELTNIKLYKYALLPGTVTTMQTSRGCPYPCGYYCPYPLVQGTKWRSMTPDRVVKEILVIKKLGINNILFRDATFTMDMKRTERICQIIINKKIEINWWCETRINVLNDKLLKIMKTAGCMGISVGVETLDEGLISKEGKPGVMLKDVINISLAAKKNNIKLHFLMIVGLPSDDVFGLYRTFKYLIKIHPETTGFSIITPYPGTKMFEDAFNERLITSFDWNNFKGNISNMKTKYLSSKEIRFGRWLLMVTSYLLKRNKFIGNIGIFFIDIVFITWKWIKK